MATPPVPSTCQAIQSQSFPSPPQAEHSIHRCFPKNYHKILDMTVMAHIAWCEIMVWLNMIWFQGEIRWTWKGLSCPSLLACPSLSPYPSTVLSHPCVNLNLIVVDKTNYHSPFSSPYPRERPRQSHIPNCPKSEKINLIWKVHFFTWYIVFPNWIIIY